MGLRSEVVKMILADDYFGGPDEAADALAGEILAISEIVEAREKAELWDRADLDSQDE